MIEASAETVIEVDDLRRSYDRRPLGCHPQLGGRDADLASHGGPVLATPGVLVPLGEYPAGVEAVAKYSPLGPFTEALLGRAVFRWEPRTT
jgi:hypothetical protein